MVRSSHLRSRAAAVVTVVLLSYVFLWNATLLEPRRPVSPRRPHDGVDASTSHTDSTPSGPPTLPIDEPAVVSGVDSSVSDGGGAGVLKPAAAGESTSAAAPSSKRPKIPEPTLFTPADGLPPKEPPYTFVAGVTDVDTLPILSMFPGEMEPWNVTDDTPALLLPNNTFPRFDAPFDVAAWIASASYTPSREKCRFIGCPATSPMLYILVSHRNRGHSLNLWVRTLRDDALSAERAIEPMCVCFAIAGECTPRRYRACNLDLI
jgi:hypothetical protein